MPGARPAGIAATLVLAVLAASCAPRPLVTHAIRARGGPLHGIVRWIDADVHASFAAGHWKWRTAYLAPDHYAWTIVTLGETNHHTFDGTAQRTFIDERQVAEDARTSAPLRTHLRFTAVVNLDALLLPGPRVAPLLAAELPPGVTSGISVVFPDDGARYRVGFDDRLLVVWAAGPVTLPPLEPGELVARFGDFRRRDGLLLSHSTTYVLNGIQLADEQTIATCPNDARLVPESFRDPERLPDCPPPADPAAWHSSYESYLTGAACAP